MMTNIVVKTCLNQKIIKNSNLIQSMKNSVMSESESYPNAEFFRIFTECSEVWIEHTT